MSNLTQHPEQTELAARFVAAKDGIREAIEEWHRLSTVVRPRLNAAYQEFFGHLERELQMVAIASSELARRVELLSVKVARGERLTSEIITLINQVVDREYARYHRRLREAFDMTTDDRNRAAASRIDATDDAELVNMYRSLVKKLHPDAAGEDGVDESYWHRVQTAYKERNVSQLRALLSVVGAADVDDAHTASWDLERWQREVETLERRRDVEERKLRRLRTQEPFVHEAELDDETWRATHTRELQSAIDDKEREIAENREHYRELTGGDLPTGTDVTKTKDEQTFEEDFMKNTYFGQR
jgi:hypothetical protein